MSCDGCLRLTSARSKMSTRAHLRRDIRCQQRDERKQHTAPGSIDEGRAPRVLGEHGLGREIVDAIREQAQQAGVARADRQPVDKGRRRAHPRAHLGQRKDDDERVDAHICEKRTARVQRDAMALDGAGGLVVHRPVHADEGGIKRDKRDERDDHLLGRRMMRHRVEVVVAMGPGFFSATTGCEGGEGGARVSPTPSWARYSRRSVSSAKASTTSRE